MAAHDSLTPVVMDNGTGLTKMGYADMSQPQYTIPTCIGLPLPQRAQSRQDGLHDLDFYVGEEAKLHTRDYGLSYPIEKGVVTNWDHMEKLWQRCFFKYLKCEPESHCVLLTEPPLNAPENRELVAEIMFETFNVPGLYIAVSAVLALTAAWEANLAKLSQRKTPEELRAYKDEFGFRERTGAVVDSGHGLTNVVPVYEGYVVGSSIRKVPLAGNDVTEFIKQLLKDRRGARAAASRRVLVGARVFGVSISMPVWCESEVRVRSRLPLCLSGLNTRRSTMPSAVPPILLTLIVIAVLFATRRATTAIRTLCPPN